MTENRRTGYGSGQAAIPLAPVPFETNKTLGLADYAYNIGQLAYEIPNIRWVIYAGNGVWTPIVYDAGGNIASLTGNSGGAVGPNSTFSVNVVGDATTINIVGSSSTNTLTASITSGGVDNGVLISSNTGAVSWLANSGTPGYVLTAQSGAPPKWVVSSASVTTTQHAVLVGGAANTIASLPVATTNTILLGATGANPTWSSYTMPSSPDAYAVVSTDTNGNITDIVPFNVGSIVIGVNFSGTVGPAWSNSLWPFSTTANQILYSSATNTVAGLSTLDNGVLITSATGVPELLANGTAGYVLTAQSGAPPHWAASSGGIGTLSADNSGTATGSTVLISGSSTGLTTTASGSTVGLTGTLIVGNGGTGEASFTAYSVVAGGTMTTAHLQSVSVAGATAGQVLTYVSSSALPTWQNATGGIATLDADSGSATGSTVTISGGSTGLTTTASSATLDLTGTLIVGNGGTGNTTFTAYSVVCAGTTSTGVFQNVSGVGSSGQVLTSNGASALPTWQAANNTLAVTSTVVSSASPYTVLSTDQFIPTDTTLGTITIKLPDSSPTPPTGRVIIIKDTTGKWATNNLTLTTVHGSITIDTLSSYIGATAFQSITVIFDGTNYEVM